MVVESDCAKRTIDISLDAREMKQMDEEGLLKSLRRLIYQACAPNALTVSIHLQIVPELREGG